MAYNRDRAPREDNAPEFIEKVVYLNRVSKTVKGGRVMKFSALVVVGDGKGTVGYGLGKAAEVSEAILKGIADAKKNMVKVSLAGTTIPHDTIGIFGAGGQIGLTYAYQKAPAAEVSIYDYSGIIFSAILGYVLLDESLSLSTIVGAALITAGGLWSYCANRKQASANR